MNGCKNEEMRNNDTLLCKCFYFPVFHLVKEIYGEKVGQKWMNSEFKMATVDGWKMKV